jgi:hypothetical protein
MDFDGLIAVQTGLGMAALFVINPINYCRLDTRDLFLIFRMQ